MPKDPAVSPNLIGLADDWEKDKSIRALVRANKGLLVWPSRKTTGVPSLAALALNHRLISYAAILWLPHNPKPKTLSVEMKNEVGFLFKNESHHASTFWSSESRSFNVHDFLNSQTPKRYVWYSIYKYFIFFIIYIYILYILILSIYNIYYISISIFEIPVTWTVTLPARFAPCGRLWGCPPPRVKFIVMRMLSDPFSLNSFEDMMIVWRRILALNKWTLITFFLH